MVRELVQYPRRGRAGHARAVAHGVSEPGMEHPVVLLRQG